MEKMPQQKIQQVSPLDAVIEAINLAKLASVTPARATFHSVSALLVVIRVSVLFSDHLLPVHI